MFCSSLDGIWTHTIDTLQHHSLNLTSSALDHSTTYVVGLPNNSYKPITNTAWVVARLCELQKGCTRLAAARDKVYQLPTHGRWFSPGTPASSTTKSGRHDIAEILLRVALNTIYQIKSNHNKTRTTPCEW